MACKAKSDNWDGVFAGRAGDRKSYSAFVHGRDRSPYSIGQVDTLGMSSSWTSYTKSGSV